jgi:preprotein translocase subunit SecG
MLGFFFWTFLILFIFVSFVMILLILIQKGRGGGLASAFGGGGGGNTAFGSKTGDVLTWITSIAFGIFLVLAILLNLLADARQRDATASATPTVVQGPPGGSGK